MKAEDTKTVKTAANELSEAYMDLIQTMKDTAREAKTTRKLWRSENKSTLVKVGLALIAFPDPTISDLVGSLLVAAGTVQAGIRRRSIYVDDIAKTFKETLKEVRETKWTL